MGVGVGELRGVVRGRRDSERGERGRESNRIRPHLLDSDSTLGCRYTNILLLKLQATSYIES